MAHPQEGPIKSSRSRATHNVSRRNQSPDFHARSRGKSPRHRPSPLKQADSKSLQDPKSRGNFRRDKLHRGGNARRPENNGRALGIMHLGSRVKRRKWARGAKKKRRRGGGRRGGPKKPLMSGGNRQPIASMRMRMDDYVPRSGRLLPISKSNEIEHAVAKARREASTRTKDTFWTKKLLDAETSHPNRWAHTGFKELYREELGYSDIEGKIADEEKQGKYAREDKEHKSSASRNVKNSPSRQRSPNERIRKLASRQLPPRNIKDGGKESRVRNSPSQVKAGLPRRPLAGSTLRSGKKSSRSNKRSYSRSYSESLSSPSDSDSDSQGHSYSSYSRSSSTGSSSSSTSSSSTSSFTSSSSGSLRSYTKHSYARHSYSRSSDSWSRSHSKSPHRHERIKSSPFSKTVQKVRIDKISRQELKKKTFVQTVSIAERQEKSMYSVAASSSKLKSKLHPPREETLLPQSKPISSTSNDVTSSRDAKITNDYYDPSNITEDSPPYRPSGSEHGEKIVQSNYDSNARRPVAESVACQDTSVADLRRTTSESDPRRLAKDAGHRRINSESDPRRLTKDTHRQPMNFESRRVSSDPRKSTDTDVRRAADIDRYKNSRLTRKTCQNKTVIHSSGLRLKRERRSNSESSSEEEEFPMKLTLSERFGKLAQLSSQRQEYEGVRMKIVREGGQDKKVYLEGGGSRSPSPLGRHNDGAHERWLREHKAEYDEYRQLYGEFRHWDPHRDLPRELPPNWDDVNVRYRYYKESGYFGDRNITMDDYLKWEEWWYRYRDWLEKYGTVQEVDTYKYRGEPKYDMTRGSSLMRWSRREKGERKRMRY